MALKATIFKARLQVADMDRDYYGEHLLTLARHPSETDERMMIRLLAFALNASEQLEFTRGLSTDDEPDLWEHSLSGEVETWIEVGVPAEDRVRKACGRADRVLIYAYGQRTASVWWKKMEAATTRFDNLQVFFLPAESCVQLATMAERNMDFSVTIQDGQLWFSSAEQSLEVTPERWK
ncbi:YaeQ family protein [Microbulbifer sp. CAU 1566]|uniref:YaeQ family protein n=1 Tax=Microbulbifer sp. CAU 1566 TaxID=2933269 RepID=UPI002003BFB8|nr:YaeQ family protein [Microbulbifer sp. CAU 1566]MCK7597189.1 YaeQ family protein [Microbulbifer sp. CAU 1566]